MLCTGYYGSYTNLETHCTWGLSLIALCLGLQTRHIPSTDRDLAYETVGLQMSTFQLPRLVMTLV